MMGMKHGYPGLNGKSACPYMATVPAKAGSACPLAKGETYMFAIELEVKKSFPKVRIKKLKQSRKRSIMLFFHLGIRAFTFRRQR